MVIVEWRTQSKVFRGKLLDLNTFDYIIQAEDGSTQEIPRECCSIIGMQTEEVKGKEVSDDLVDWRSLQW